MKIIGITGGTGAGKSTVCAELRKYGAKIVDADKISKEVTEKGSSALSEIALTFGEEVLLPDESLDRKKLGSIVFSDPQKLKALNDITHKYIFEIMSREIKSANEEIVVLDVPLLFQSDFPFECDLTVAVIADKEERIKRIMARDGIEKEAVIARISNQMSDAEYKKKADICFENDGDIEKVKEFAKKLCRG